VTVSAAQLCQSQAHAVVGIHQVAQYRRAQHAHTERAVDLADLTLEVLIADHDAIPFSVLTSRNAIAMTVFTTSVVVESLSANLTSIWPSAKRDRRERAKPVGAGRAMPCKTVANFPVLIDADIPVFQEDVTVLCDELWHGHLSESTTSPDYTIISLFI
jgi:hypothetical protein